MTDQLGSAVGEGQSDDEDTIDIVPGRFSILMPR
jgi:hypothetical protein